MDALQPFSDAGKHAGAGGSLKSSQTFRFAAGAVSAEINGLLNESRTLHRLARGKPQQNSPFWSKALEL